MGFLGLLSAKTWASLGAVVAVSAAVWGAYLAVDSRGFARCERDAVLSAAHAQEEAHQTYLAEVERGNALSAELVKTQRRLDATKSEYLSYAHGIAGNCPADLGLLTHAAATGASLPAATGAPADPAATVGAAAIGANIAENYARCLANAAQLSTLIDWHTKKDLKDE